MRILEITVDHKDPGEILKACKEAREKEGIEQVCYIVGIIQVECEDMGHDVCGKYHYRVQYDYSLEGN